MLASLFSKDSIKWIAVLAAILLGGMVLYKLDQGAAARQRVKELEAIVEIHTEQARIAGRINFGQQRLADEAEKKRAETEGKLRHALEELEKKPPVASRVCVDRDTARRLRDL